MKCPRCKGDMWDNRDRKTNPKAPDYKCKDKECKGAVWPAGTSTQRTGKAAQSPDDRSSRIERQHSQEMALMYFKLELEFAIANGTVAALPNTQKLREMTSWFQRDVGHGQEPEQ